MAKKPTKHTAAKRTPTKKTITHPRATGDPVFAQPTPTPDPTSFRDPVTDQKLKEVGTVEPFPAPRGGALSDMTLSAVVRRMKVAAVPHGFRSTFRDWASERTNYPRDVAEMALAHAIGDRVEAAYRRGDLFEKRRRLMADWATFCGRKQPTGGVVSIRRA